MNGVDRVLRRFWAMLLFAAVGVSAVWGQAVSPSAYWKNEIVFPDDVFRVAGTSAADPGWVKFTILLPPFNPEVVYFQDCRQYKFHYGFAVNELDPFVGMSRGEFNEVTLYAAGQQAVLGAVILPPSGGWPIPPAYPEYGIQFVGRDAYSRQQIRDMFNAVKARVVADEGVKAFYFPSYEQMEVAKENVEWFESQGISTGSTARWVDGWEFVLQRGVGAGGVEVCCGGGD